MLTAAAALAYTPQPRRANTPCAPRQRQRAAAVSAVANELSAGLPAELSIGLPAADTFPPWEPRSFFRFEVLHESRKPGSRARLGRIHTPHGTIDTPSYVPVGTSAALKGLTNEMAVAAGVELMFCNTYHLMVHPGSETVAAAGGLHEYMRRPGPIITDSGGFQVFSLARATSEDGPELKRRTDKKNEATLTRVSEHGVSFRSYFDPAVEIELTPESSVRAQKDLGSDIIIPLDELPPYHITRERLAQSVALSHRWEARSLREHLGDVRQQAMYAVVHGGTDEALRRHSAEYLSSLPFDGFAIGGSLGRDGAEMVAMLSKLMGWLPRQRPNHLLGISDEASVRAVVPLGIDTFDSCLATRVARHGSLYTRGGTVNIGQGKYRADFGPIDPTLPTIEHSRAYLHHLYRVREPLFQTLASLHNLMYMGALTKELCERIAADDI